MSNTEKPQFGDQIPMSKCPVGHYLDDGFFLFELVRSGDVVKHTRKPNSPCLVVYKKFMHADATFKENNVQSPHKEGDVITTFFDEPTMTYAGTKEQADKVYEMSCQAFIEAEKAG